MDLQQSRGFLCRHESSPLAKLVQIAEDFDPDGLIDSTDADRRKTACLDELGDDIAGVLIIACIKQHIGLRGTTRARLERCRGQRAKGLYELRSRRKQGAENLPRG